MDGFVNVESYILTCHIYIAAKILKNCMGNTSYNKETWDLPYT